MSLSQSDFELLLQANRILSSKLDATDVLQAVMELATKVVKAEASSLLLLDEIKNELYFDVALGSVGPSVKQIRLKVGEGIAGWVAKERRPLIVNDVSADPRFSSRVDKSTRFQTKSILAVPLEAKGKLIGVVEALNKEHDGQFSSQDQEVFEIFGSQAAIAIENARLFSEVTREREKLNTVFSEMSDGVMLLDAERRILLINASATRLLGLVPEKTVGETFQAGLLPDFNSTPPLEEVFSKKDHLHEVEWVRRAGKDLVVSALFVHLEPDEKGTEQGTLIMMQDVTEEKRGEMLKRNFLSLISHKLRTPLTVILGYGPLLSSDTSKMTEGQKKAIHAICAQGQHLSGLVDKLLRFTLVESDSFEKKMAPCSLEPLLHEAIKTGVEEGLEEKIKVDVSLASLPKISADPALLREVFKNLLENAFKFNDKPDKKILVDAKEQGDFVTLHVTDNGVGIPPEEQEKVFQKFYQVENSFTGQVAGAGLGLAFCKKVMEAMRGSILLESEIGKGTRVTLKFPKA
ncbi:MAG: Adaptive-response sensory-kinase SasA [Elusimicrobia bacterium]|nr:Adaptive-response sensory-kinase SasA [Elusimicrobiota bacterium]